MKKIKILDCGPSLKDVSNQFGQSPEWIMNNLKNYDCEFEWIKIYSDQKIKNISGDAWIITGSPRSVYDQEEWMLDLEENIKNAGINDFPILSSLILDISALDLFHFSRCGSLSVHDPGISSKS